MQNVHFCSDYRSEIRFGISPNLSEGQALLEYKALAVGRFIGAAGRQPETKSLFIPQCYDTFRVLGRKKTAYCTECVISFVSSVDLSPL